MRRSNDSPAPHRVVNNPNKQPRFAKAVEEAQLEQRERILRHFRHHMCVYYLKKGRDDGDPKVALRDSSPCSSKMLTNSSSSTKNDELMNYLSLSDGVKILTKMLKLLRNFEN